MSGTSSGSSAKRLYRPSHWPEYRYLMPWLEVATKGLCDDARTRIREEFRDHFQDALAQQVAAGLDEETAARQAVEGLGSPRRALRDFRRVHLTARQAKLVDAVARRSPMLRRALGFFLLAFCFNPTVAMLLGVPDWPLRVGLFAVGLTAAFVLEAAAPKLYRRGHQRFALAASATAEACLFCVILSGVRDPGLYLWFAGAVIVVAAANHLPVLVKLSRADADPLRPS